MCTVTFIPKGKTEFILTSNRDEAPKRITLPPDFYDIEATQLLFPKDQLAGGTWIGLSDKSRLVCLLNGGFTKHKRQASYRMSRGIVVKDVLTSQDSIATIKNYNLDDIEPFTLILVDWKNELQLFELIWDGETKHVSRLPLEPKLWSSSTLYTADMKSERQTWFKAYVSLEDLSQESILEFHYNAGRENDAYGVVMDRGFVKTTSITQVEKSMCDLTMTYNDLQEGSMSKTNFEIPEIINE